MFRVTHDHSLMILFARQYLPVSYSIESDSTFVHTEHAVYYNYLPLKTIVVSTVAHLLLSALEWYVCTHGIVWKQS